MALTREFVATIKAKAERDPTFRVSMLRSAAAAFLKGESELGRLTLRDYVNATIGFEDLAEGLGMTQSSLMRMLSVKGNPSSNNLGAIMAYLQKREGANLEVIDANTAPRTASRRLKKA